MRRLPTLLPIAAILLAWQSCAGPAARAQAQPPCATFTAARCLDRLQNCSVSYLTPQPTCIAGAPVDGCAQLTSATSCSNNGCLWDPHIAHCFLTLEQVRSIFNCTTWSLGQPSPLNFTSKACPFHMCMFDTDARACVVRSVTNVTSGGTTVVGAATSNLAAWSQFPSVRSQSLQFQTVVTWPINIDLSRPTRLIIGLGSATQQTGVQALYSKASPCTTLGADLDVAAPPQAIRFPGWEGLLRRYVVSWVQANQNLDFNDGTLTGLAMRQYFGSVIIGRNNSIVTKVTVSADGNSLVFEVMPISLPWAVSTCGAKFGVAYGQSADKSVAYYSTPFSLVLWSASGGWSSVSTLYVTNQLVTGTATISSSTAYQIEAWQRETQAVQGACPIGQQALSIIVDIVYTNVQDPAVFVGPRSAADVRPAGGTRSCYHDAVIGFQQLGCSSSSLSCTTRINALSTCFTIPLDGTAFLNCSNAPSAVRSADLGPASNATYPAWFDQIHPFDIDVYACPMAASGGGAAEGCIQVHPPPQAPDVALVSVPIYAFPKTFADIPPIAIRFAMLTADNTASLADDNSAPVVNSFTGSLNATNNPYTTRVLQDLPSVTPMDRVAMVVQIANSTLRNVYTLSLQLEGIRIIPADAAGVVRSDLAPATWKQIQAFTVFAPRAFQQGVCSSCQLLPMCANAIGCDGFSAWSGALTQLFPTAAAWFFVLPYNLAVAGLASTFVVQSGHQAQTFFVAKEGLSHSHIGGGSGREWTPTKHASTSFATDADGSAALASDLAMADPVVSSDGSTTHASSALFFRASWLTGAVAPPECQGEFHCWSRLEKAAVVCIPLLGALVLLFCLLWHRNRRNAMRETMKSFKIPQKTLDGNGRLHSRRPSALPRMHSPTSSASFSAGHVSLAAPLSASAVKLHLRSPSAPPTHVQSPRGSDRAGFVTPTSPQSASARPAASPRAQLAAQAAV